jgi:hypothetical protein
MSQTVNNLVDTLRNELQQYGEMLARLDEQQQFAMRRSADDLLQSVSFIQEQGDRMQAARARRETVFGELLKEQLLPSDSTFASVIPLLPPSYQPLVQALVKENNELLIRVQQRARQNHLLLLRSLELMQAFMVSLFPGGPAPVYGGNGFVMNGTLSKSAALYEAVG